MPFAHTIRRVPASALRRVLREEATGGSQPMEAVKIGVLGGLLLAGLAGFCVVRFAPSDAPQPLIRHNSAPPPEDNRGPK